MIIFGIWNIFKSVLYATIGRDYFIYSSGIADMIAELDTADIIIAPGMDIEQLYVASIFVLIFAYAIIALLLRLFVFRAAVAETRGKEKSWFYLILAVIMFLYELISFVLSFSSGLDVVIDGDYVVSHIVDLTSILAMLQFIVSAIIARKLRKDMKEQNYAD